MLGKSGGRTNKVPAPPSDTKRGGGDKCSSQKECAYGGLRLERFCDLPRGECMSRRKKSSPGGQLTGCGSGFAFHCESLGRPLEGLMQVSVPRGMVSLSYGQGHWGRADCELGRGD